MPSGAVNVVSTFTGKAPSGPGAGPAFGLVRLNPGVTIQQAAGAVQRAHGDINALDPYGALLVSADAPGTLETVLTPDNLMSVLRTSPNSFKKARPYLNGAFLDLLGPASAGATQQMVLDGKPGYYVEACFMDTQDGREHVQLGMERLIRIVK